MTRTELVKKLTSYAGVDESYTASFMESFLLLIHRQLQSSSTFELPLNISFSQKKVVRNNKEFFLITCESTDAFDAPTEELVFAVPTLRDETKSDKYSVFSISIGKQVIPNKEMIESGFAFEPSFSLKNYCREKAEALVQRGEFTTAVSTPSDFAWDFSSSTIDDQTTTDDSLHEEISKEIQEFTWDFGNNWKRELQEEEILSVQPSLDDVVNHTFVEEKIDETKDDEFPAWNFGGDEVESSIETDDQSKSQTKIEEVDFSKLHEKLNGIKPAHEYEEVKAKDKTQELSIDLSEFEKLYESQSHAEDYESNLLSDDFWGKENVPSDDEYVHVQSTSEFVLTQEQEKLLEETDPFSNYTTEKSEPELADNSSFSIWDEAMPSSPFEKTEEDKYVVPDEEIVEEEEPGTQKEKGSKFWSIISAALIVFIFMVLYWKMWGIPAWLKVESAAAEAVKIKPTVIEREYDVPVSYPYEVKVNETPKVEMEVQNNNVATNTDGKTTTLKELPPKTYVDASDIFSKNNPRNRVSGKKIETQEPPTSSKPKETVAKQAVKKKEIIKESAPANKRASLVRDNIYLEGSNYVVQLSSWKSESIADQEVARLKRKGIKAFKTSAVIPQKGGTWYRVKVGGFSSAEEASRFYNSIK